MTKACKQFYSQNDSIQRFFTKVGCGTFATGKYDQFIFPHKFSSGDYLSIYDDGDNNIVVLIHPTPDSKDTLEAHMPYEDVFDTMRNDMLEEMEYKMLISVMTLILAVGKDVKWIMTLTLCLIPLNKILYINIYTWISEQNNAAKDLVKRDNFLFIREWFREGGYSEQKEAEQKANISCKVNKFIDFVVYVIGGETCFMIKGGFCFLSLRHTL